MTATKHLGGRTKLVRAAAALSIFLGAVLAVVPIPMATPAARALSNAVAIDSSGFHPDLLRIVVGQAVAWTNLDSAEHTVTSEWPGAKPTPTPTPAVPTASAAPTVSPEPLFDLVLGPGESGSITFDTVGEYDYACSNHPDETGVILVFLEAPATPSPSAGLPDAGYLPQGRPGRMPLVVLGVVLMTAGALLALAVSRGSRAPDRTRAR